MKSLVSREQPGKANKFLALLWGGFLLAVAAGTVGWHFGETITGNIFLVILMLLLLTPAAAAYLTLWWLAIEEFGSKLLWLLPLIIIPRLGITAIALGPYLYLVYLTVVNVRIHLARRKS